MTKHRKWLSICLVICLIGGLGGGIWYRNKKIEERKLSLIYIPKVVDGTNDFWKSVILGAKMAAKEYNAEISVLAPSEENDVKRQNERWKKQSKVNRMPFFFHLQASLIQMNFSKRQKIWESGSVLLIPIQKKKSRI